MKFKRFLLVCFVVIISYASAEQSVEPSKHSSEADDTESILREHLLKEVSDASDESIEHKQEDKTYSINKHGNKSEMLLAELKHMLANATKVSNITNHEEVETSTPYDVKHYLTEQQKYYMLRVNLLGIGIRVVHDIIPIPVANTDQYKKSMAGLLDKVQAARETTANMTSTNMHNITLEAAHKLQMEIARANETGSSQATKKKPTGHSTEVSMSSLLGQNFVKSPHLFVFSFGIVSCRQFPHDQYISNKNCI